MEGGKAHGPNSRDGEGRVPAGAVTRILEELRHGDLEARERLVALVYDELHQLAAIHLRSERTGHTLPPTALVNEAFLRLFGESGSSWENRAHFFGAAGQAMRRVLVDYARRRSAAKRGSGLAPEELRDEPADEVQVERILAVDGALEQLGAEDERKRKLVELRFFAGLSMEEAATALDVSLATAKRDWAYAKAWLYRELREDLPE